MLGLEFVRQIGYYVVGQSCTITSGKGVEEMKNYKTDRITVRLTPEQLTQIDALAAENKIDRSKVIRTIMTIGLWHYPRKDNDGIADTTPSLTKTDMP